MTLRDLLPEDDLDDLDDDEDEEEEDDDEEVDEDEDDLSSHEQDESRDLLRHCAAGCGGSATRASC